MSAIKFKTVAVDEEINTVLSMDSNKNDGNYSFEFIRSNGKKEVLNVGYYTNESPMDNVIDVDIQPDTTLVIISGLRIFR